ncbi:MULTISPECIES: LLM class F420-dependent oxidoreductase [Mycolicibacterium]|jgi:probable F420-dependent oxidoreductase|uniref:Oxidoreductase/luciferase-like protein n=2 Tax=Mycolicibacterium TaxID=1866885 RepID=A0A378U5L6_MYCFO|nr:LLM class F420-dependent oxidoreductase [Mycolicibacterium fortuitum]STZ72565.1 oxidoreductase/luciferase-like protein [Mycolicibacterium fortuitum]
MYIDCNIGGIVSGSDEAGIAGLVAQAARAERIGFDGIWSTDVDRDPFLSLAIAAMTTTGVQLGTGVAVAFARNPMTTAIAANDLQEMSGGRFVLGLGTQIQAHIERRFSMPWSAPADRMCEYVHALRAIWQAWRTGERLDFRGVHYQHTLMTPMFTPTPHPYGDPKIVVSAVGPKMTQAAAQVADGLLVHGFTTRRYLSEVTLPAVTAVLHETSRTRTDFTVSYPGLIASGRTEQEMNHAIEAVRRQIAFYGSTPAYRHVLELHGWHDLHTELHRLSKAGDWATMSALIDDEVLDTFAVVGEPAEIGPQVISRFSGLVDRFTLLTPYPLAEEAAAAIVSGMRS